MDIDYEAIIAIALHHAVVAAIVAMGVVKLAPNFTMWAVDKVAGMFGYDPYDRSGKNL